MKAYSAEIIAVGTELLLGGTVNTDAQDVSQLLSELGINVYFHTVVGDNPERMMQAIDIAKSRADIIIATGGLGPTYDDVTKQTLAKAFGKKLVLNEDTADKIRTFFAMRLPNMKMPENNLRQAELPEDCVIFENSVGTAPGCAFEAGGKHVLMLPGPPRECREMLKTGAGPYLKRLSEAEIHSHNIHIFGLGESSVEELLRPLMENLYNPTLAPYAKDGEVMLRLTAKAPTKIEAEQLMAPVLAQVRETLGDLIYGIDTHSLEYTVIELLKEHELTLATAESCTGGLLSKRLTDIPGASKVYLGGAVSYSEHSKAELLGVEHGLMKKKGVVSSEVALAMADGIRLKLGADIGIGITGIAGPDSDGSGLAPGTVFVALTTDAESLCGRPGLFRDRDRVRISAASYALDMIRRLLRKG